MTSEQITEIVTDLFPNERRAVFVLIYQRAVALGQGRGDYRALPGVRDALVGAGADIDECKSRMFRSMRNMVRESAVAKVDALFA